HGKQVVARRDARSALMDDLFRRCVAQERLEGSFQLAWRLEPAAGIDVFFEEVIQGAWNVAAHRVDGLILATETVGAAGVDQYALTALNVLQNIAEGHHEHRMLAQCERPPRRVVGAGDKPALRPYPG